MKRRKRGRKGRESRYRYFYSSIYWGWLSTSE